MGELKPTLDIGELTAIARKNVRPDYWPDPCVAREMVEKYPATFLALVAREGQSPTPLPMSSAPRDGTIVRLFVEYTAEDADHPLEDSDAAWTIGANNFDNDCIDRWTFAGWCWSHDHWTEGRGNPVGWLPFHGESA